MIGVPAGTGPGLGQDGRVLIVRATKKLLDRIGPPNLGEGEQSTTWMGQWYATAMFWKPQVALFVNEPTLLPVLLPLAPAATLLARFPRQLAAVPAAHGTPGEVIEQIAEFRDHGMRHVVVGNAGAIQPSLRKSAATTAPYIKVVRGLRKL